MKAILIYGLISLAILYFAFLVFLYFAQEKLFFHPEVLADQYQFPFDSNFEELEIPGADGTQLNALLFKADSAKGVIIYFHGNGGSINGAGWIAEDLLAYDYDVLMYDYRGYGKSRGKFSEKMFYADALACYQFLAQKYPEAQITVYGRSLGATMATYVAAHQKPRQLILETPFHSMRDMAQRWAFLFPVDLILKFPFRSDKYIKDVHCPIHIFHGTQDFTIPLASAQKLYQIRPEGIGFYIIERGNHHNLSHFQKFRDQLGLVLEN